MVRAARWLAVWAVFTVVMRFVTGFAGIYQGWLDTATTAALVVAFWCLASWWRSRGERKATVQ